MIKKIRLEPYCSEPFDVDEVGVVIAAVPDGSISIEKNREITLDDIFKVASEVHNVACTTHESDANGPAIFCLACFKQKMIQYADKKEEVSK